jgi:translocation and assembly module TamB
LSKIKKILFYIFLSLLSGTLIYFYIWEKPKLEKLVTKYIEKMSENEEIPFKIKIENTHFSIIPLQVELYNTTFIPKKNISQTISEFKLSFIAVRPSLIDIFLGKMWISQATIKGSTIKAYIKETSESNSLDIDLELNKWLKKIPLSQLNIQNIKLDINIQNKHYIKTEDLFIKAYNEKSSLILTVKDPNLEYKFQENGKFINFLIDIQLMATSNTFSLSKIKIVKDSSYFLASGNLIFSKSPLNVDELQIKTRLKSDISDVHKWSNEIYKNDYLKILKGQIKTDLSIIKKSKSKDYSMSIDSVFDELQIGKVLLGHIEAKANLPNDKEINIESIKAKLPGNNSVKITNASVSLDKPYNIKANVDVDNAEVQSFLKLSGIADIPVWSKISGNLTCQGLYDNKLSIDCPGAITVTDIDIKNKSRTKSIIAAKKASIDGKLNLSETGIAFEAQAKLPTTIGQSKGFIDFEKGFEISYETSNLNFEEIGPVADLELKGTAKCKGQTKGNSDYAIFFIDIESENFEFEKYFFGKLTSHLDYKSGVLDFKNLDGNLESTRYNGNLQIDLLKDNIKGDIQLPFFRMEDIQQIILKKVDLKQKFLGSGSGRLQLDTPFDINQLNFILDARLFKGQAFNEDYNEARLKAEAVDGIIIIQEGKLQKEESTFDIKGTIDTKLISDLQFTVKDGFLQHSSLIKAYGFPLAGEFDAQGKIFGPLDKPIIKAKADIKTLLFNKKKYGQGFFQYDNSKKQTNLQFNIPEKIDLFVLLPELDSQELFVNLTANEFDIAPLISYLVSSDDTRSYTIDTSGEISGKINMNDFWSSEFSSTLKEVKIDYKANKIVTTIPTSIEMKNNSLFLNEISFIGKNQFIKITQPYTQPQSTQFIINARINIGFFKLFAPFIEKIDGYSTIRLELTLNNNNMKLLGSSFTTDGFIKFPGFPHAIEDLSADVLFNQNKVLINSLTGQIAGGRLIGNGEINLKNSKEYDLKINTDMENLNLNFPEGYNTRGRAHLSLSGKGLPFTLAGNYTITEGLIDNNFDSASKSNKTDLLEELLKEDISSPLLLNLDIKTENSIEVRNSLVEGFVEGNFTVFDKMTSPRIKGEIHFEDDSISTSIVKFNKNEFQVTSSSFVFNGEHPINPKLTLRSKTRLNSYDIDLLLQGHASKPILTVTSQPPLPETQIISMLALGQLPDQFNQSNNNVNNQNSTTGSNKSSNFEIGTSLLNNNPLGKEIKERTGFDVQFSSSFDDQSSSAVPKITVRRKLTKKLQVSFSQATGNSSQGEGRVSYELNNRLSTIFRVTNNSTNSVNSSSSNTNTVRQNNPFGIDLEYKLEFD